MSWIRIKEEHPESEQTRPDIRNCLPHGSFRIAERAWVSGNCPSIREAAIASRRAPRGVENVVYRHIGIVGDATEILRESSSRVLQ